MKAAFFRLPGEVELRDLPMPEPGPGEALVCVQACGLCGSDVEAFRSHSSDWHRRGHEYAGEVVRVGEGVEHLKPGDVVAGIGSLPCGGCAACRRGEPYYCAKPRWFGGDAFAEFLCKPAEFFLPIPGLTPVEGAMIEPLAVALNFVRQAGARLGCTALLIGAGPIGLMALRLCRAAGAAKVYVSHPSTSQARAQQAWAYGADAVFHPDQEDIVSRVLEREPEGVNCVLVTIKPSVGIPQAARVCMIGGVIAFIGLEAAAEAEIRIDIDRLHFRKIRIIPCHNAPNRLLFPQAAECLQRKGIDADDLVSHRFPFHAINEAFHLAASRDPAMVKVVIDFMAGSRDCPKQS